MKHPEVRAFNHFDAQEESNEKQIKIGEWARQQHDQGLDDRASRPHPYYTRWLPPGTKVAISSRSGTIENQKYCWEGTLEQWQHLYQEISKEVDSSSDEQKQKAAIMHYLQLKKPLKPEDRETEVPHTLAEFHEWFVADETNAEWGVFIPCTAADSIEFPL